MKVRRDRQTLWCFRAALDGLAEADSAGEGAEDALAQKGDTDRGTPLAPSMLALDALLQRAQAQESPERAFRLYQANAGQLQADGEQEQMEATRIIRFLASEPGLSRKQLLRIRRNFARRYHPDCSTGASPEMAAHHMAIINALIDQALRKASV